MAKDKTILLSGGGGEFAKQFIKSNKLHNIIAPPKEEMNITIPSDINKFIKKYSPDIFLHAAAYTRPMKKHQDRPEVSVQTNIIGTCNIVLACIKYGIKLIYISTDYVYPGTRGNYSEEGPLSPFAGDNDGNTKYGWSKLGGECAIRMHDNNLILRVCMCNKPFPHNKGAADVKKSLIYNSEAAEITHKLLNETGVINVGGKAQSVYDFAKKDNPNLQKISRKDIKDVNIAPDTSMDISRLKNII